jgi:tetrahydromethanopterin S-methyltransferase subunit G
MPPHDDLARIDARLDSIDQSLNNHVTDLSSCHNLIKKDIEWLKWLVKGSIGAAIIAMFSALGALIVNLITK